MNKPYFIYKDATQVSVEIEYLIPIDVPDSYQQKDSSKAYRVHDLDTWVELRFLRKYITNPSLVLGYGQGGKKFGNDRFGQLSKTQICFVFKPEMLSKRGIEESNLTEQNKTELLLNFCMGYLAKFTREYSAVTQQYWVTPLNLEDIISAKFNVSFKDGTNHPGFVDAIGGIDFKPSGHTLSKEQDQELRNRLKYGVIDLVEQSLLSAKKFISEGEYKLAIVQCAIAFEYKTYKTIKGRTSNRKIDRELKNPDCGCHVGISQLCKIGLKKLFDVDFGSTEIYRLYDKTVIRKRNKIVHGDTNITITKEEAIDALNNTVSALNYIASEFEKIDTAQ